MDEKAWINDKIPLFFYLNCNTIYWGSRVNVKPVISTKFEIHLDYRYLLFISGIDAIENCKIYETYMHFCRISYTGKMSQVFKKAKFWWYQFIYISLLLVNLWYLMISPQIYYKIIFFTSLIAFWIFFPRIIQFSS